MHVWARVCMCVCARVRVRARMRARARVCVCVNVHTGLQFIDEVDLLALEITRLLDHLGKREMHVSCLSLSRCSTLPVLALDYWIEKPWVLAGALHSDPDTLWRYRTRVRHQVPTLGPYRSAL